jgi:CDP-glycerol glycerophosphotransferase (TagB/SpsB family)
LRKREKDGKNKGEWGKKESEVKERIKFMTEEKKMDSERENKKKQKKRKEKERKRKRRQNQKNKTLDFSLRVSRSMLQSAFSLPTMLVRVFHSLPIEKVKEKEKRKQRKKKKKKTLESVNGTILLSPRTSSIDSPIL